MTCKRLDVTINSTTTDARYPFLNFLRDSTRLKQRFSKLRNIADGTLTIRELIRGVTYRTRTIVGVARRIKILDS